MAYPAGLQVSFDNRSHLKGSLIAFGNTTFSLSHILVYIIHVFLRDFWSCVPLPTTLPGMRLHMKSILVAEDDPILWRILEKTFITYAENFEFVLVQDGYEAMNLLRTEPVDLVVTEIQMPHMTGLVLLAYINTYHPSIPCMVITSYSTSRLKSKVPSGVLRFFQKPFKADDLAQAVVAALERDYPAQTKDGISVVGFLNMIEMEQISCVPWRGCDVDDSVRR